MKFEVEYYREIIPEWRDYYFNYEYLLSILTSIKPLYKRYKSLDPEAPFAVEDDEKSAIAESRDSFHVAIATEMQKFNGFFKYTYNQSIKKKLAQLSHNIFEFAVMAPGETRKFYRFSIKNGLERYFREVIMFRDFFNLNIKAVNIITKRYKKYYSVLRVYDFQFVRMFYKRLLHTFAYQSAPELDKVMTACQNLYLDHIYPQNPKKGTENLKKILNNVQFSTGEAQTIGFFLGVIFLAMIIVIMLLIENQFFDFEQTNPRSKEFIDFIMPIFRGSLILFMHLLSWGVVIYIWGNYNINYKRVLRIQMEYSTPFQIMRRAFFFMCVWVLCFLYSCFSITSTTYELRGFFNYQVGIYAPVIPFFLFVIYLFFPIKGCFNFSGRVWLLKAIFLGYMISPFYKTVFLSNYINSNAGAYSLPMRDFAYSVCYFVNVIGSGSATNTCTEQTWYLVVEIIIVFWSRVYRLFFAINNWCWSNDADRPRLFYSVLDSLTYFLTNIFNYMQRIPSAKETFFVLWMVMLCWNVIGKYFWDIRNDWKLLQFQKKNYWLRPHLAFGKPRIYVLCMVSYFFLVAAQVIQASPIEVFTIPIVRNMVVTVSGCLDAVRMGMWNFFKLEIQHISLLSYDKSESEVFSIIEDFKLPNDYLEKANMNSPIVKAAIREGFDRAIAKMKDEEFLLDTDINYKVFLKRFSKLEDSELGGLSKAVDAMNVNAQRKVFSKSGEEEMLKASEKQSSLKKTITSEVKLEKERLERYESESEEEAKKALPGGKAEVARGRLAETSLASEHSFEYVAFDQTVELPNPARLSPFGQAAFAESFADSEKQFNKPFDNQQDFKPPLSTDRIEVGSRRNSGDEEVVVPGISSRNNPSDSEEKEPNGV